MTMLKHIDVEVNSDLMTERKFSGTLADLACAVLNERLALSAACKPKVISVSEKTWTVEVRPSEVNQITWYNREHLKLSVYYSVKA